MVFSISLPVCGHPTFLHVTLDSIKAQSVQYELAVLDATPDDSAQAIISAYRTLIHYEYHGQDDGQAAAIQEGWDHGSGEIVAWLNADDYYFPDALAKVAAAFRDHPDVDVVYGHAVYVSPHGDFIMYFPAFNTDISLLRRGNIICQPSCFVRRSAMRQVGGLNTDLHYAMDWDFWLRLYHAQHTFYFLDEPLSVVRIHAETKTLSGSKLRYQEIDAILRANVNGLRRQISLKSFRHYDLQHKRSSFLDHCNYSTYSILRYLRNALETTQKLSIRGLECWTNVVNNECQVELPWYQNRPPRELAIVADKPLELCVSYFGDTIELSGQGQVRVTFNGKKINAYRYRSELPLTNKSVLHFSLSCAEPGWHLVSLDVRI